MKLFPIGVTLVVLGGLLLGSSYVWRSMIPTESLLTEEQALANIEARGQYHADSFNQAGESQELVASKTRYEAEAEKLDSVLAFRDLTPYILRVLGFITLAVGVLLLVVQQNRE